MRASLRRALQTSGALALLSCGGGDSTAPDSANAARVLVDPSSATLVVGGTQQLTAVATNPTGAVVPGAVTWSSSAEGIATISIDGLVTGAAPGTATITARIHGLSAAIPVTVEPATVGSIQIEPASVTMDAGETATATATVRTSSGVVINGKVVRWLTSDASVVGGTVDGNTATLQGVGPGSAVVTADVDGVTGTLPVTVRAAPPQPVASVTLSPASATMAVGSVLPIVATLRDARGNVLTARPVSWTTSAPAVVGGLVAGNVASVQGLAVGVAIITATSEGVSGTSTITVVATSGGPIPLNCTALAGGVVFAQDGQYLGRLRNRYDHDSILNEYGPYGSEFSHTSMYNRYSRYGSPYFSESAYNKYTPIPPQLYVETQFAAYVTKNTFLTPRIDPDALRGCDFP